MRKKFINCKVWLLIFSFLLSIQMFSQSPVGAWERYFQDVTNKVSELIVELCDLDINNQYETKN